MRAVVGLIIATFAALLSAAGYDLTEVTYQGSFAWAPDWVEPTSMPRDADLYWGTYLYQKHSLLRANYKQRGLSIIRAGVQGPVGQVDLDCADMSGPVAITGEDVHELDRDGDGIGCEWR